MTEIPERIMDEAEAADSKCQRENCPRMDCNGFLCVKALEAVYLAAEQRGRDEERERAGSILDAVSSTLSRHMNDKAIAELIDILADVIRAGDNPSQHQPSPSEIA